MEAKMDMHGMPMHSMHNTFWRENQVIVAFHSATPLISTDGINNGSSILEKLGLESQRQKLNTFLEEHGLNYTLSFYSEENDHQKVSSPEPGPLNRGVEQKGSVFTPPPGVYLFGLQRPIQLDFGEVDTSIVTFFNFTRKSAGTQLNEASVNPEAGASSGSTRDENDTGEHHKGRHHVKSPVAQIVNEFNTQLATLNGDQQVPISAASPVWLCGATQTDRPIPQGCPLTPPIPVDDSCAFWHFSLPDLAPSELQSMTGDGVTVFILDTLPDRDVISEATEEAGDDNLLLFDVNRHVTFNYDIWNNVWAQRQGDPGIPVTAVGKDIYGRHFAFKMPDHGVFIAGTVLDIVPQARVECIRVLDDYCVGDMDLLLGALQSIHDRMQPGGNLYQKPVVINLSLVIPTKEEAQSKGVNTDIGGTTNDVETCLRQPIQSLVDLGAIIVASAGNEADLRENPSGNHPPALYPAAFANPPDSINGVIPVGAVDGSGNVTTYSCYPGPRGIATYGGEIPTAIPPNPPSNDPTAIVSDAMRGIFSAGFYPPLSDDPPADEYEPPNDHGWAYWVGTSFATPIISAVAARVLDWKSKGGSVADVPGAIIGAAGSAQTQWENLDPSTGVAGGSTIGPMLLAVQECQVVDEDEEDEEQEEVDVVEVVEVVVQEGNQ